MSSFFDTKIEFLKGVGPQKASLLGEELGIFTYGDLLEHYPFRHEDRTQFHRINELNDQMQAAQIKGRLRSLDKIGEGKKQRLVGDFTDGTGILTLTWFQAITWLEKSLKPGNEYIVYGKPTLFGGNFQITHPEMDVLTPANENKGYFQAIYSLTEKLKVHTVIFFII
jgi:ATP-dependent DNA helicase RecG